MSHKKRATSPIKYPGGKGYLAEWIVSLMPTHLTYVEPCVGGGAILFAKTFEGISEVVNDRYSPLMDFWLVLANSKHFEKFLRRCQATPFSQTLWSKCHARLQKPGDDILENAFDFFVDCRMSLAGRMTSFTPISKSRIRRGMNEQVAAWLTSIDGLTEVHTRVKRVLMLNDKSVNVIKRMDHPETLQYIDPHYWTDAGPPKGQYRCPMTKEDHIEHLELLPKCQSKIMISGYRSKLYDKALKSWNRHEMQIANHASGAKTKKIMTECIWCNF